MRWKSIERYTLAIKSKGAGTVVTDTHSASTQGNSGLVTLVRLPPPQNRKQPSSINHLIHNNSNPTQIIHFRSHRIASTIPRNPNNPQAQQQPQNQITHASQQRVSMGIPGHFSKISIGTRSFAIKINCEARIRPTKPVLKQLRRLVNYEIS